MVLIGGASINEYGQNEGGQPGDQTGKEVYIQPFYVHPKGWNLIRAKDKVVRQKLAEDMRYACENDNVGYSYWEHCYSLYNECKKYNFNISKVDIPVETNCAKTVLCCAKFAGINVKDFSTADELEKFEETGQFDIITDEAYTSNPTNILTGDILVTKKKGHTVICVEGSDYLYSYYEFLASTALCGTYITNNDCHMRKLPGTDKESLKVILEGEKVFCSGIIAMDESGKTWYYCEHEKQRGFISEKMLDNLEV